MKPLRWQKIKEKTGEKNLKKKLEEDFKRSNIQERRKNKKLSN